MIIPGQVLCAHKLCLTEMVLQEAGGASATPPSLSKLEFETRMRSKLAEAYRIPEQATQMDVSKSTTT